MTMFRAALSVLRFELVRTITVSRIGAWLVIALFPPSIVFLILIGPVEPTELQLGMPLFLLIPQVTCLLGLLLWASPIVHSELEGKTWTYLVVRPRGKTVLLVGKYLSATIWAASAALLALTLVACVISAYGALDDPLRLWVAFAALIVMSSLGYGALFLVIGTLFHRRAMVICVAFTFVWEFTITIIPAVIQQFTIAFHLRSLMIEWMDWYVPTELSQLFGDQTATYHVAMLLGMTITLLVIADFVVHNREYITASEA